MSVYLLTYLHGVFILSCSLLFRCSQALPWIRHIPVPWSRQGSRLRRTYRANFYYSFL